MPVNQKVAVLATIELRLDNIRSLLERETDSEWRADLIESLGELAGRMPLSTLLKLKAEEGTDMTLLPTANKTKLVKLLRAKGYDVPSGRDARFGRLGRGRIRTYVLEWVDGEKRRRLAFYSGCGGRPYLSVGKEWTWLTMAEVIQFGLVE